MKKELQKELFELGKGVFSNSDRVPVNHYGFECGDGWFDILKRMFEELREQGCTDVCIAQVKEKFGRLTIYHGCTSNTVPASIIAKAEKESCSTCEDCGKPGKSMRSSTGWIRTQCPVCEYKKRLTRESIHIVKGTK